MAPLNRSGIRSLFGVFAVLAVAILSTTACRKDRGKTAPTTAPTPTGDATPVARIDDTVITVGDIQDRINKQSGFARGRYASLEKRKELLENLIRIEVMAKEAERRGYDQDPEVVRVKQQQMISRFLQKDFESKLKVEDVPDVDVEKYYKEHPEEFNRQDEVRVSQILVKDKAKADKVVAAARAADRNDAKTFRDLVAKVSEDEDSKPRGGDLTSFDRASVALPKSIVDAAFALKEIGDVSAPVKSDKGYHVLRLTQKRPGFSRPLAEVKRQIQQRLFRDMRTKALDAFVADLRKKFTVTIDEANLAKVTVDMGADPIGTGMGPGLAGRGPGHPPGMGMGPPGAPFGNSATAPVRPAPERKGP